MTRIILALLAATVSLSVSAASIDLNSSRSNATDATTERGKPTKEQILDCSFAIDQKGLRRQATEAQQKECRTFNESRGNNTRGIAVSDPGVPNDKNTLKR